MQSLSTKTTKVGIGKTRVRQFNIIVMCSAQANSLFHVGFGILFFKQTIHGGKTDRVSGIGFAIVAVALQLISAISIDVILLKISSETKQSRSIDTLAAQSNYLEYNVFAVIKYILKLKINTKIYAYFLSNKGPIFLYLFIFFYTCFVYHSFCRYKSLSYHRFTAFSTNILNAYASQNQLQTG